MFSYMLGEVTLMFEGSPLLLSYLGGYAVRVVFGGKDNTLVVFFCFFVFVAVACRMSHRPVLCLIVVARTE